jgi:probable F420-dependent oxidoreductase
LAVPSRAEWIRLVQKAEDQGYDVVVVADHFEASWFPPLTALMAAADATTRLRVAPYVLDNDFRHPAVLAREAATLDLLSDGRFELGIGAGWAGSDYEQTGISFDPPKVRVERLIEAVHVIKRFFVDDTVTFHGQHYTVNALVGAPKPVQRPYPPIMIAGSGRRMLSFAAREANIVGLLMSSAESNLHLADGSTAATYQRLQWIKAAAGERFETLEINTTVFDVVVTDQGQHAADELARAWGCTPEQVLDSIHVLVGSIDHICEKIQMWREEFGISYLAVPGEEQMDAFAPIVARLAGT